MRYRQPRLNKYHIETLEVKVQWRNGAIQTLAVSLFYINRDENFPSTEASFSVDGGDAQAGLSPQPPAVPIKKRKATNQMDQAYHDYSRVPEAVERKKASNFPAKLHLILSDPECSHVS